MTPQKIAERLREWGIRVTPQRLAIAEAVLNSEDHPSVQQIYERVQTHFPSMTLATIYSTLDVLERSRLIQELPFPQFSRYESNLAPHVNLVCIQCGNIKDASAGEEAVVRLREQVANESNFQVTWQRVDFHGWCRHCAAEREAQPAEA